MASEDPGAIGTLLLKLGAAMMAAALSIAVGVTLVVMHRAPESSTVEDSAPI